MLNVTRTELEMVIVALRARGELLDALSTDAMIPDAKKIMAARAEEYRVLAERLNAGRDAL